MSKGLGTIELMTPEESNIFPLHNSEAVDKPSSELTDDKSVNQLETEPITVELIETVDAQEVELIVSSIDEQEDPLKQEISDLERQKQTLKAEIAALTNQKAQLLSQQVVEIKETIEQIIKEGLKELEQRKQSLEISLEQLERRKERIREEMRTTFAGTSQELAIRVQGFKDYLVGSLQDLAAAAEQLELPSFETYEKPKISQPSSPPPQEAPQAQFVKQGFQDQGRRIRELLEQYRIRPDYYGSPWQLRRTFEPIHAERVQQWFFSQGGRGAIRSMGSRLQNILVASTIMSILYNLYGDRFRTLVLANSPERLGEWRRGLQDCLGISRSDFGPERGVVLFEAPEALIQKAERLEDEKQLPLIIIDDTEERLNFALLQFPFWLAFASEPQPSSSGWY